MYIYLGLLSVIYVASFIIRRVIKENKRQEKIILALGLFLMYLLCVLRHSSVGFDTIGYEEIYYQTKYHEWFDFNWVYFESGYIFLMKLCISLGLSFNGFLAIVYLIVFIPMFFFLKRYSKDAVLSLTIYICYTFFAFNLSGIRNSIAFSICLLAFMVVTKKSFKSFLLFIVLTLIAMLFHKSAIIFFIIPLFVYLPCSKKTLPLYAIVSVLLIVFREYVYVFAHEVLGKESVHISEVTLGGSTFLFIALFALSLIFAWIRKEGGRLDNKNYIKLEKQDRQASSIFLHVLYMAVLSFFIVGTSGTLIRAAIFLQLFITVTIPFDLNVLPAKVRPLAKLAIIVFFLAYYYFATLRVNALGIVPYKFFWQ